MSSAVEQGMQEIQTQLVDYLLEYLDTGVFRNKNNQTYVRAYSKVLDLADQDDNGEHVYNYYIKTIENYTRRIAQTNFNRLTGTQLLDALIRAWDNHKIFVYWMRKIFCYLDRYHVKNKQVTPLFQAGLEIFRNCIYTQVKDNASQAVIIEIQREREGEFIDRGRLKQIATFFVQIGLHDVEIVKTRDESGDKLLWKGNQNFCYYNDDFENRFLQDSQIHYRTKSAGWCSSLSCPEYLSSAKRVLEEEEDRADRILDQKTKFEILTIVEREVITEHAQTISEMEGTGCVEMFRHDKRDELKLMFSIFKRVESTLQNITSKMSPYIESRGTILVQDPKLQENAVEFTAQLLEFKAEIDSMVDYSFDNHSQFQRARDLSFQNFMNKNKMSAPFIAGYCDNEMRKGLKGVNETETDARLEAIIRLFVCLHDRDVFIRNYTRNLSRRLLDQTSISDEAEQRMIAKLKVECGHNIVNKITNMFNDIALSKQLMEEFKGQQHAGAPGGISMDVSVLRSGCWPDQNTEACTMPPELSTCAKFFEQFYGRKHQGRNMTWLLGFGQCEITTTFAAKRYTCIVNPYQAAILLQFNQSDTLTIAQLKSTTKLADRTLKSCLINFFNPKMKLLNKQSRGKVLEENEPLTVNADFQCRNIRVNFIPKRPKQSDEDKKEDDVQVTQERKHVLDAVIVRIMKARKTLRHQELITESMRQVTQFKPQPPMIKGQIESLIQREFLKRDEEDRNIYIYIP